MKYANEHLHALIRAFCFTVSRSKMIHEHEICILKQKPNYVLFPSLLKRTEVTNYYSFCLILNMSWLL